jgi:cytochrome subunit of sulfide dehydrogenase
MSKICIGSLGAGLFAAACCLAMPLHAADPNNARNLAAACANCHGTDGRSQGGVPPLAGQDKSHMLQQLQDFKAGKRPSTIMQQLAKGYTDEQLESIAGYFSAIRAASPVSAPRMGY